MLVDIRLKTAIPNADKPVKILKVYHQPGASVREGESLFEAEGGKGAVVVKAVISGVIRNIAAAAGDTVDADTVLATLEGQEAVEPAPAAPAAGFDYFGVMVKTVKRELEGDIAIIGGGPGGYVAAIKAAQLGARAVLIEKDALGGTCLNRGCIPTKSLVRSAQVLNTLRRSGVFGVVAEGAAVDFKRVVERKEAVVGQLRDGIKQLLSHSGVTVVPGVAALADDHTVVVKCADGETTVRARNIIIATGSVPVRIPVPGAELAEVLTSDQALRLEKLPRSMVIIGGGVIGMEFAFVFASFGVKVAVIEALDKCLAASCDDDICAASARRAEGKGIRIFTGAKVESIVRTETGECLVAFLHDQTVKYIPAERVLLSVGRKSFTGGLGLEAAGVRLNERGLGVAVNARLQTNIAHVYAVGDVTGKLQLAHVASHQGLVAVRNIMGDSCEMDYSVIPSAIFTEPEIATVGMGEAAARRDGREVAVGRFPFAANGKALTYGETDGFVKLIVDKPTGRILGGSIIGLHATDLVAEIALAIRNGLTVEQVSATVHAHPTTAEIMPEAALAALGRAIHYIE